MTKYTVEISTLPHTRKSIDAISAEQAVALYHQDLNSSSWGRVIPSETVVYTPAREKVVYGPQQVVASVAKEFDLKSYDAMSLI